MRRSAAAALIAAACHCAAAQEPRIVPNPLSLVREPGELRIDESTVIVVDARDEGAQRAAALLAELAARSPGVRLSIRHQPAHGAIELRRTADAAAPPEGYRLAVGPQGALLSASTQAGLTHAATTFWQLLARRGGHLAAPAVRIEDAPRFAWRGLMLDSARHYQSPEFLRRFIDAMAIHKLNVLHWHLTDDQAWRLEIRKYPRLTSVGAWRVPAGAAARADIDAATGKPRLYGGFYSQETVRELVAHAAARGITIIPEIEMPGHATAALVAYPELAATRSPPTEVPADWGVYPNVYSLEEKSLRFIEDVLEEVMALFPGRYLHVGGDEVEKGQWQETPQSRSRLRELGIEDAARAQVHFTQRVARFLQSRGRRLVGWDEILEPGLPPSAVVMSWRGIDGALRAAAEGHDTVLAAHPVLYFDNRQGGSRAEPPGRARIVSLQEVYAFEPMPAGIAAGRRRHVLGLQGNVWTEHIRTEERVGWMTFPRAAAVAELGWSEPERRDWNDFVRRMETMYARYAALGIAHRPPGTPASGDGAGRSAKASHDLRLCSEHIALGLEDDAPLDGERAVFLVDILNPCWIYPQAPLGDARALVASVGQVPFNFQIGEDVKKIGFPAATTPHGELEVRLGSCAGDVIASMPLAPATRSNAVSQLPAVPIEPRPGVHDLCLRFAQRALDPLWVLDSIRIVGAQR